MKHHGIGVGYKYPHDFDGADVEQQYLPDELRERRYYLPTDQGYEATISGRQEARAEARTRARQAGRTPKDRNASPVVNKSDLMRSRETSRKKPLQLVESKTVGDGVAILVYRPAGTS